VPAGTLALPAACRHRNNAVIANDLGSAAIQSVHSCPVTVHGCQRRRWRSQMRADIETMPSMPATAGARQSSQCIHAHSLCMDASGDAGARSCVQTSKQCCHSERPRERGNPVSAFAPCHCAWMPAATLALPGCAQALTPRWSQQWQHSRERGSVHSSIAISQIHEESKTQPHAGACLQANLVVSAVSQCATVKSDIARCMS